MEAVKTLVFIVALVTASLSRRWCLAIIAFLLPMGVLLPSASFKGLNALNLLLLACVMQAFVFGQSAPNPGRRRDPLTLPVGILLVTVFISFVRVQVGWVAPSATLQSSALYDNIVAFKGMVIPILLYYCARRLAQEDDVIRYAVMGALAGYLLQAISGASEFLGGTSIDARATGHFGGSGMLGHFLAAYTMMPGAVLLQGARGRIFIGAMIAAGFSVLGILGSLSRGALLSFGVGMTSMAAAKRSLWIVVIAAVVSTAPVWLPQDYLDRFKESVAADRTGLSSVPGFESAEELDLGSEGRVALWRAGLNMVADKPILGVGLGQFANSLTDYGYTGRKIRAAHNVPMSLAAECGIPAALAHFALMFTLGLYMFRLASAHPGTLSSTFGLGLFGSTVAFTASGMVLPDFYRGSYAGAYFILIGVAMNLYFTGKGEEDKSKDEVSSGSRAP